MQKMKTVLKSVDSNELPHGLSKILGGEKFIGAPMSLERETLTGLYMHLLFWTRKTSLIGGVFLI